MTGPRRGIVVAGTVAAALVLSACGATYIETSATTAPPGVVPTTLAPVDPATPLPELLDEIRGLMLHLDEQIVDNAEPAVTLARIEELWSAAEPGVRQADLDAIYNFEQALTYVRTGVHRKRPADASKGYKVWLDVVAALPTEQ